MDDDEDSENGDTEVVAGPSLEAFLKHSKWDLCDKHYEQWSGPSFTLRGEAELGQQDPKACWGRFPPEVEEQWTAGYGTGVSVSLVASASAC